MTTSNPDDGMCHETSGFLFSHPCDRFSIQQCIRCQKPICENHGHATPEGVVCTTCLKKQKQAEKQANPDDQSPTVSSYGHTYYGDDPYFYSYHYYPGYGHTVFHQTSDPSTATTPATPSPDMISGADFDDDDNRNQPHDPDDFTEGDAESLQREEDADFESDMGAS